jgi:hypothetical protein
MIKSALVRSNVTGKVGRYIDTNELIFIPSTDIPRGENVDILLVATELNVTDGDWVYDGVLVYQVFGTPTPKDYSWSKVIFSTNKDHHTPQLSDQSIKLLIDYYNEYKCMPESVDVEIIEGEDYLAGFYGGNEIWAAYPDKLKLNQQGGIEITIPENEIEDTLNAFKEASDKLMNKFKVIDHLYTKEQIYQMLEECDSTRLTWSSDIDEWLNKH